MRSSSCAGGDRPSDPDLFAKKSFRLISNEFVAYARKPTCIGSVDDLNKTVLVFLNRKVSNQPPFERYVVTKNAHYPPDAIVGIYCTTSLRLATKV